MRELEKESNLTKTPFAKNGRYILPVLLLCIFALLQLVGEAPWLQNLDSAREGKTPDQLLKLQHAEEEVSKLKTELAESKEQLKKLQTAEEKVSNLQSQLESSREELDKLQNSNTTKSTSTPVFDPTNICSVLPQSSSATRLWKEHLPAIYEASSAIFEHMEKFPLEGEFDRLRSIVEEVLTPSRLRRSIQHLPTSSHHIVKNVMQKLQMRILDPENNPPLQIAVFGGSVTLGRGCSSPDRMSHKGCAWPQRLEYFVNQIFGQELIQVHNLSIGGTSTSTGTIKIRYWMYDGGKTQRELQKRGPDVIINSYSTNDSTPPWGKKWPEDDLITMVRDRVRKSNQAFIRTALESKLCEIPPLVIHVDDYLGPQQPALLGELGYVSEMTQLAKYYDTVGISYAQVVRDIAYQNQTETDFHNANDVHYGRFAHATIALSVEFALLELFINYCDDEYNINSNTTGLVANKADTIDSLPHPMTKEEMKRGNYFLPPPLTPDLIQENVTIEYEAALDAAYRNYVKNDCGTYDSNSDATVDDRSPCIVSWISTPGFFDDWQIQLFMKKHQTQNDGWESERLKAEGWSNKDGWIATKANASFTLEFAAEKKVKTMTIYYLKSWGEKWKDSKAKFTVSRVLPDNATKVVGQLEIDGVHPDEDYHYSFTLFETIELDETIEVGEKVSLRVDLVSGGHFKIMGMMLCNK